MRIKTMLTLVFTVTVLFGASLSHAKNGTVTQITSLDSQLRFWLQECGYDNYYYVNKNDASYDQAKLVLMAARFSGRPVAVPGSCPTAANVRALQIDLLKY
ncbi:MAG: hypothetical protein GXP08_04645 [Gammaproteobacteria bacterium]|nr:hypothetical protein [Gammaproteobacteria bacterium]